MAWGMTWGMAYTEDAPPICSDLVGLNVLSTSKSFVLQAVALLSLLFFCKGTVPLEAKLLIFSSSYCIFDWFSESSWLHVQYDGKVCVCWRPQGTVYIPWAGPNSVHKVQYISPGMVLIACGWNPLVRGNGDLEEGAEFNEWGVLEVQGGQLQGWPSLVVSHRSIPPCQLTLCLSILCKFWDYWACSVMINLQDSSL